MIAGGHRRRRAAVSRVSRGRGRADVRPAVDARPHVGRREVHPRLRLTERRRLHGGGSDQSGIVRDDLAELCAGLEPLVSLRGCCEREHAVDVDASAAGSDELVGTLEVRRRPHRRAVDRRAASTRAGRGAPAGSGRDVAPQTTIRPRCRAAASERSHVASPTVSTTTSTPSPSVASLHRLRRRRRRRGSRRRRRPSARARSSFSALDEVTIVRAPSARQISNAASRDAAADAPDQHPFALAERRPS